MTISLRVASSVACALVALAAGPVAAQTPSAGAVSFEAAAQTRPAPRQQRPQLFDWRAYFLLDGNSMAASESFDAILGKTRLSAPGFGGEVLNLYGGLFARVAVSSMKESGERVVVLDGEVIPLGIPVEITMRPVEISAGWRLRPMLGGRLVPYGGVGLVRLRYTETSDFAEGDENSDESFSGFNVFGGVEARVAPWVIAGVELQYRGVDALGDGGVSKEFGETNLGGTTFRILVGIRR